MVSRDTDDPFLKDILALHANLLRAAQEWGQGATLGAEVENLRRTALCLNHQRYCRLIPRYRTLAAGQNLLAAVDPDTIVNELMFTTDLFKSYQPAWLSGGDFVALTDWLSSLFSAPIAASLDGVTDISEWRTRLRAAGVFVTYSSGTSGRMSFVPRDQMTWNALRRNSTAYADRSWFAAAPGQRPVFDCLVAGPQGDGTGIQGAGAGLASWATRSHFLFDGAPTGAKGPDAYERAIAFIRGSREAERRLLIFGVPFQVRRLCDQVLARCGPLPLASGSMVVTGGGWKSFAGERIPRHQLEELIASAFGIARTQSVDGYSTAELSCTLIGCAEGAYHVPPLMEAVVLDEALMGNIGAEGTGILGFLDPFALSYPGFIITGDLGKLRSGGCGCGRTGWFIDGEIRRAPGQELRGCGGVMASVTA